MRAPLIAGAVALTAGAALAGAPEHPAADRPIQLAAQAQTPGAPLIGAATQPPMFVPQSGGAYVPPVLSGLIAATGDSYIGNGGGAAWASGTFTVTVGNGASYFGDLLPMANNRILADAGWGDGVGAQSSWGVVDRMASPRHDLGTAAASSATIASGSTTTLTINTASVATFGVGEPLTGTGVTGQGVVITAQLSGTAGGAGTYSVLNPNGVTITNVAIGTTPNPAFAHTLAGNDATWSINGAGVYSLLNDPANIIFVNNATNDLGDGIGVAQSITNVSEELDALGPHETSIEGVPITGANKLVILGTAHPRGVAFSKMEVHSIAASVTPSYAPNTGAGTWTSDTCNGAIDDPVVVANYSGGTIVNGVNTVFTKAGTSASQPSTPGTYNVTPAGVYWFNASDVALGVKVALNYCFLGLANPSLASYLDYHYWTLSTAADYIANCTDCTGTDYGKPGALYNRPWVTTADTFAAMLDPATGPSGNHTYLNLPGTSFEGLHNDSYGSYLNAKVEAAALATLVPISTPVFTYPAYNSQYVNKASGVLTTFSGTLPGVMATQIGAIHAAFPSGGGFEICYLLSCGIDNGSGSLVGNGVAFAGVHGSATVSSGTINYSTGAYSITFSDDPPVNGRVIAYGDPIETVSGTQIKAGNYLINGQLDWANISALGSGGTLSTITAARCNTANLGASGSNYVPQGWTLSGSSADETALSAGTMVVTCGYGTAPDGTPGFWVSVVGQASTAPGFTLAENITSPATYISSGSTGVAPDITRGYLRMTYARGPNGHLYGARAPAIKQSNTVSTAGPVFGTFCPTTNCTIIVGQASSYSGIVSLSNLDLQQYGGTADSRDLVTAPANADNDTEPNTLTTSGVTITFSPSAASEPVDYTVWFQNVAERITPN